MDADELSQQIETMRHQLEALFPANGSLPAAFESVQVALEELRVAEEELRQQNEELMESRRALDLERQRYQELFAFAPDGYLVTDLDGTIREANRAAGALLGIDPEFQIGKPLTVWVPREERRAFRRGLLRLRQVGRIQEWEVRLQPRRGEPFAAAVTAETMLGPDRSPAGVRWLLRDISERKRTEERLRREEAAHGEAEAARLALLEADRQKNQFLAMLAHELRNPLAPILTAVQLLELTDVPDAQQRRAREIIERQVHHQARLIDDLLDVSRITHGKIALRRELCDLKEAVARAVEEHRPAIEARCQNLSINLPDDTSPLIEARVLDAFAGSGALGIEALSRGAAHATFLDNDPTAIKLIGENLRKIGETAVAKVVRGDATRPPPTREACDLVFLDPPYRSSLAGPALTALAAAGWLKPGAIATVELANTEDLPPPTGFEVLDERRYGAAKILILRRA